MENIPCGSFTLIPSYKNEETSYDLVPNQIALEINGNSVKIPENFRVVGFSANGQVLDSKGNGIEGIKVFVNGKEKATTTQEGRYRLEKMSSGEYEITFTAPKQTFSSLSKHWITPNQANLPDSSLLGVDFCGRIIIDPSLAHQTKQVRDVVLLDRDGNEVTTTKTKENGDYCFHGVSTFSEYTVRPLVYSEESSFLIFDPSERKVQVNNKPIESENFSQSKVQLSGQIQCIDQACNMQELENFQVGLTIKEPSSSFFKMGSISNQNQFLFQDIYPGNYILSVNYPLWCWGNNGQNIVVKGDAIDNLSLQQTGYRIHLSSSHDDILLHYYHTLSPNDVFQYKTKQGDQNEICLSKSGEYSFSIESNLKFKQNQFTFQTGSKENQLDIQVTHYPINGMIKAPKGTSSDSLYVHISSSLTQKEIQIPVELVSNANNGGDENVDYFKYLYWATLGEKIDIIPKSSKELLFYPSSTQSSIDSHLENGYEVESFSARPGLFLQGIIEPVPIEGVEITVKHKTQDQKIILSVKSDAQGNYKAGPLYDHLDYITEAHLDGYYFTSSPNGFKAVELSQITIHVVDQFGESIEGVLLSLTGSAAFYSDSDTNSNGIGRFEELFPGDYYLRALLKEYSFKPTNIPIDLKEGINLDVQVNATRVAYSAFGSILSLSGDPERGAVISATSTTQGEYEETQTDDHGHFRLRGLKPSLSYDFKVKSTDKIERASPSSISLEIGNEDITNLNFVSFRSVNRVDIFGSVHVDDEFIDSLKVELYVYNKKQNQDELTKSISLDLFKSFDFSQLPKEVFTLKLVSSLNSNLYDFKETSITIDIPRLQSDGKLENNRYFVPLTFNAELHHQPTEVANVSFYPLIILNVLFFAFWYRAELRDFYQSRSAPASRGVSSGNDWLPKHHAKYSGGKKQKKR